ncbi:hypothetical protein LCGC14_2808500, partial [marine sediment metagenome]
MSRAILAAVCVLARTCLAVAVAGQVTDVRAIHRAGQTFVTFTEPGEPAPAKVTWGQVRDALAGSKASFVIYAHSTRITAWNIKQAQRLGEVKRFSGCNLNGRNPEYLIAQAMIKPDKVGELTQGYNGLIRRWHMDHPRMDRYPIERFVIPAVGGKGKTRRLTPGTGLYVAHPTKAG